MRGKEFNKMYRLGKQEGIQSERKRVSEIIDNINFSLILLYGSPKQLKEELLAKIDSEKIAE